MTVTINKTKVQVINKAKQRPVSIAVAIVLIIIFSLYKTGLWTKLPCDNSLWKNASRDFIHVDFYHLLVNMIGLYYTSDIEKQVGSLKYTGLIAIIVLLSSVVTFLVNKVFTLRCSIGYSGVLLGLMAYSLLARKERLDWKPVAYLIAASVNPGAGNISISGHLIGIIAGIAAFFMYKLIE